MSIITEVIVDQFVEKFRVILVILIVAELLIRIVFNRKNYDHKDGVANLVIGLGNRIATDFVWLSVMFGGFYVAHELTPLRIDMSQWWSWPLILVMSDFSFYCYHRISHSLRVLWTIHGVHHSSKDYNLSTAIRGSILENSFRWSFWLPLPLIGFSPESALIAYLFIRLHQIGLHNQYVPRIPLLEGIITTPSHHRVHHGTNPRYIDKNYGGVLVIWDRLFGTYQPEEESVIFGILKPIETYNPLKIMFGDLGSLAKEIRNAPNWRAALACLYGRSDS